MGLIRNIVKLCSFSKDEKDSKQFHQQQVGYMEKVGDALVVMPYGTHANVPQDYLGLLLSANEQSKFVIPLSSKERVKPVESGEVVFFHPVTKSKVHFKNNGDIDIETDADVNVICKDINATCSNINATASANITATCVQASVTASAKADVTAPLIELTGAVTITGPLTVTGPSTLAAVAAASVAVTGLLTQGGTSIGKTHTHSGVATGTSNSGAVT